MNTTDSLLTIVRRDLPGLDCGLFVIPKPDVGFWSRIGLSRPPFADVLDALACPMLLAAGSEPYRRILLPVLDPDGKKMGPNTMDSAPCLRGERPDVATPWFDPVA